MKSSVKNIIKYALVVIILALTIYALVNNLDIEKFYDVLISIKWEYAIYAGIVAMVSNWIRGVRWKIYLEPIIHTADVHRTLKQKFTTYLNLFSAVMVGYAVNNVTPRGGELVRPFVYARREKLSKSAVFATIIVERACDVAFLMLMFAIVFAISRSTIKIAFPWLDNTTLTMFGGALFVAVLLIFIIISTNFFDNIIGKLAQKLFPKRYERIEQVWKSFKQGFASFKEPRSYLKNFIYSALIWILYALPLYILFFGFDFQSTLHLGLSDACILVIVSGVGSTIAPTPGSIGVYQWLIVTALIHLHPAISQEEALAYSLVMNGINIFFQVIVGGAFMLRENLRKLPTDIDMAE
jgi:uncharacterized protein (TIRG00374 family)